MVHLESVQINNTEYRQSAKYIFTQLITGYRGIIIFNHMPNETELELIRKIMNDE